MNITINRVPHNPPAEITQISYSILCRKAGMPIDANPEIFYWLPGSEESTNTVERGHYAPLVDGIRFTVSIKNIHLLTTYYCDSCGKLFWSCKKLAENKRICEECINP